MDNLSVKVIKDSTLDQETNVLKLPDYAVERETYVGVKKALEKIGGKWSRKHGGFIFELNPSERIEQIVNGESPNVKKEFQFFETTPEVVHQMMRLVPFESSVQYKILEPSAGKGAIIEGILDKLRWFDNAPISKSTIDYCELMPENQQILDKKYKYSSIIRKVGEDFLKLKSERYYDFVIANPPFTKNQDIDHFYKMYECLKSGGIMITLMSTSWTDGQQQKHQAFREFLSSLKNISILTLPPGTFKKSGTSVPTQLIKVIKE